MNGELSIGSTMLLYIIMFMLCIVTYAFSIKGWNWVDSNEKAIKKRGCWGIILSVIALLIVCILAGVRSDNVGADTAGYGVLALKLAKGRTLSRYLLGKTEFSFYGLAYIISLFTENVGLWLGILELLTILPVFYIIYNERKDIPPILPIVVFLFKFYNYSLCIIRQSLACSFVLLAAYFFYKKKYFLFLLWGIIAVGFHSTAFIGLLGYILIFSLLSNRQKKSYKVLMVISVILVISVTQLPKIASILLSSGLLPSYFLKFIYFFEGGSISSYGVFECAYRLLLFTIIVCMLIKQRNNDLFEKYMLITSAVGCSLYVLCDITWGINTVYRFTQYFDYSFIFSIALIPKSVKIRFGSSKRGKWFMSGLVVTMLIFYWLMVYIIMPDGLGFKTEHFSFR